MRTRPFRRSLLSFASLALALAFTPVASGPAGAGQVPGPRVLAPRVLAYGMDARGTVVRQTDTLTVERLRTTERVRQRLAPGEVLYRVTLQGRYRPRALRYVVVAAGAPVAFGIPRADLRALVAVTTDPSVLTDPIEVVYGDPSAGPAIAPWTPPAPEGTASLGRAAPGPYDVTRTEYDFGDRAFQPAGLGGRVELRADVHYPTDLSGGPYPLVLFLHGNHAACSRGDRAGYEWPCPDGWEPIPNHEGYDYIAKRLASYGFIVASVSGNGINVLGNYVDDTGMRQRGELLEKHVDLWNSWNSVGGDPFGATFVGAVDMGRLGVMGHSRGGEGAVWQVLVDRERPSPYGIDAVLPLAPVDFTRVTVNDVPLGVLLPYCDGDVWDLQGVHFFDDARYLMPGDTTPKATVTVFGANHNFFNTVWSPSSGVPGSFDDGWDCAGRLTERLQRKVAIAYVVGYFRAYLDGATGRERLWTGESSPARLAKGQTAVTYLAPDTAATRMDVDRFDSTGSLGTNQLGGAVIASDMGVTGWCSNVYDMPCVPGELSYLDIHLSYPWFGPAGPGLQEAILGWSSTSDGKASIRFEIPPGSDDVTPYDAFVFRTVPNPGYSANEGYDYQDLVVAIEDQDGTAAQVAAADAGNDALAYPFQRSRRGFGGHIIMNQIRFPLSAFAGIDLSRVAAVELRFSRTDRGVIDVSDMAFVKGAA